MGFDEDWVEDPELEALIDQELGRSELLVDPQKDLFLDSKPPGESCLSPFDCTWFPLISTHIYEFNHGDVWKVNSRWIDFNLYTVDPIDRNSFGFGASNNDFPELENILPYPFVGLEGDSISTYEKFSNLFEKQINEMRSEGGFSPLKINFSLVEDFPTRFEMERGLRERRTRAKISYIPFPPDVSASFVESYNCFLG